MTARRISQASGVLAIAAAAVAVAAFFVSSRPDPKARPRSSEEVQSRVMSPYCPGVLLADCPTSEAVRLRLRINEKVQSGWTNSQIDEWLVESYSEKVLASPRGSYAWLVPSAWVLAGAGLVGLLALRWTRREAPDAEEPEIAAIDRARLDNELRAFSEESTE